LLSQLRPGGTILLHDSNLFRPSNLWRHALAALPDLLDECAARGLRVMSLRDQTRSSNVSLSMLIAAAAGADARPA
jgi:peptidoglycan-N-acetylglucosamine deacetylase